MARGRKPIPKTQREISESLQEPFVPPVGAPGFQSTGNPNNANGVNRAEQTSFKDDTVKPLSIGIQDLDESVMYYFQNVIKPFVIQNGERIAVPIIYGSPEKWKSFQKDGYYRDLNGRMMAPLIMFKKNNKSNYVTSFELLRYDDCYIELLEDYPCNSNNELQRREGQLIRETEKVINKYVAGRTDAEYKFDNRDKICKKIQCECGGHHLYNHTARHLKTNKHKKYINEQSKNNITNV